MKAFIVKAPGEAVVEDIPEPTIAVGDAVLRVRMVGMCGSDLTIFRGTNPLVNYPRVLGHEIAATVLEPGSSGLAIGTNVAVLPYTSCGRCASCRQGKTNACHFNQTMGVQRDGAMMELVSTPGEKLYPANLSLKELALVEPLTVGAHAVARGRVTMGDVVAVFGCGGVGLGAISAASFRGATVIAIDMDDVKLETARKAGAKHLIHSGRDDLHVKLAQFTEGYGPDVAIEAIGLPLTFRAAVEEVAFTGRVVYIGYAKEKIAFETRLFVQKELDIMGSRNALPEDFRAVIRMLEAGRFPVEEAVSAIVQLEDAPQMLADWSDAPTKFTKILVNVG
jgi:threonine dehydrogenase-like Zn-dependent dehydrogenase